MLIINFAHPLTPDQVTELERLAGRAAARVIDVAVQIDQLAALRPQVVEVVSAAGLSATEWQTELLLVNLPGYAPVAGCILAEIEGRSGHLPPIIKVRPLTGVPLTSYEVAEIINLQDVRDEARLRRQS